MRWQGKFVQVAVSLHFMKVLKGENARSVALKQNSQLTKAKDINVLFAIHSPCKITFAPNVVVN